MGKFNSRQTEPAAVITLYPDGSRKLGQWQYHLRPIEGWVYETWTEPSNPEERPDDEIHQDHALQQQ